MSRKNKTVKSIKCEKYTPSDTIDIIHIIANQDVLINGEYKRRMFSINQGYNADVNNGIYSVVNNFGNKVILSERFVERYFDIISVSIRKEQ